MPMLPDEVKVAALRKEREFWLDRASISTVEFEYYMEQAEKCEAQLPEYDVEFMLLESERAPTVQLWSTSGAALWNLSASSRAPSVHPFLTR